MKFKTLSAGKAAFKRRKRKVTRMVFCEQWSPQEIAEAREKWREAYSGPGRVVEYTPEKRPPIFLYDKP